jgi:hypothetical protein
MKFRLGRYNAFIGGDDDDDDEDGDNYSMVFSDLILIV